MFRRFRRLNPTGGLDPDQIRSLNAANQLMENGQPGQAAPLFAALAAGLETQHPRRAANIHARAAHAYADSAQENLALVQAQAALRMFIQYGMTGRTPVFYANIRRKFLNHKMSAAAASLQKEFHLPDTPPPVPAQDQAQALKRRHLPGSCPKCGAPLRPADVDWIDNRSAECSYCGSMVNTLE